MNEGEIYREIFDWNADRNTIYQEEGRPVGPMSIPEMRALAERIAVTARRADGGQVGYEDHELSTREWFAGQAVAGILASERYSRDQVVPKAYEIADEMMVARKR